MRDESEVLKKVLLKASKIGARLFRNNRGLFYTMAGNKVRAGLEAEGASDCIGFIPVVITPEMVGKKVAVFFAVEVKHTQWKKPTTETEEKQAKFIDIISKNGGIAFFCNDAEKIGEKILETLR